MLAESDLKNNSSSEPKKDVLQKRIDLSDQSFDGGFDNIHSAVEHHDHHEAGLDHDLSSGYWKKKLTWKEGWKKIWKPATKQIWKPAWKQIWKPKWVLKNVEKRCIASVRHKS